MPKKTDKKDKKATGKQFTDEVEGFVKELWGKVVEYATVGAEEASSVSSSAKMRIDIETLKFKRGKLARTLGEQYFKEWVVDSSIAVAGTKKILGQIKKLDDEVSGLEARIAGAKADKTSSPPARAPAKKTPAKKASARKAPVKKKPAAMKTSAKAKTRKPAAKPKAATKTGTKKTKKERETTSKV